jgi:hypothetical protein
MRVLKVLAAVPLWFLLTAEASPTPTPAPTPVLAYLTLSVTAGPPSTTISVSGNSFNPNQYIILLWDGVPSQGMATVTTNAQGSFANVNVKPYPRAAPGAHKICAHVNPFPCAQFQLLPQPSPSPHASPSATPPQSPSPSVSPSILAIPAGNSSNGLDVLLRPPFVFLPIIAILAFVLAVGYWLFGRLPRPQKNLAAASIVHRSARPTSMPINPGATPPPVDDAPPAEPPWSGPRES